MLTFDPESHTYRWNMIKRAGVSEILESVGAQVDGSWRSISGAEFMDNPEALHFGNVFHDFCRRDLLGQRFTHDPDLDPWIRGYRKFFEEYQPEPIMFEGKSLVEVPQYCKRYRYGYTPDFPCVIHGKSTVVDWKTGGICAAHWCQQGAYVTGLHELTKISRWQTMVVQVVEEDFVPYIHVPDQARRDIDLWKSILNVYRTVVPQVLEKEAA